VSAAQAIPLGETGFDQLLGFTIPLRHARGRVVRLGPVLDVVLSAHDYPLPIKHLLAEALVLTALIGSLLKDDGSQLTIQAQTQGGIVELPIWRLPSTMLVRASATRELFPLKVIRCRRHAKLISPSQSKCRL
jgi:redox-regulated HSP33 family molecular chaperone